MKIRSQFNDVYDFIMTPYESQDKNDINTVIYNRLQKTSFHNKNEFTPSLSKVLQNVFIDYKTPIFKPYPKSIMDKLNNFRNMNNFRQTSGTSYTNNQLVVILGFDVFIFNAYSVHLSDFNYLNSKHSLSKTFIEFQKSFNLLDDNGKDLQIPECLLHCPVSIIMRNSHHFCDGLYIENNDKNKDYCIISNFSLSNLDNIGNPILKDTVQQINLSNLMSLEKLYMSIESRLAWEREYQGNEKMVELSNQSKIAKAGFNQQSFKHRKQKS